MPHPRCYGGLRYLVVVEPDGCVFVVSLLALELDGAGAVDDEPLVLWLVEPPEALGFFSVSLVEDEELEPEGALGVAEDEELAEPDGGVALPPTDAEPDVEPDGVLGVVDEDEDVVSRGADGVVVVLDDEERWSGPRSHAARPRAIATAIARVESLMRPPWLGYGKAVAVCVPDRSVTALCDTSRLGL
jgi:hypothetical protein